MLLPGWQGNGHSCSQPAGLGLRHGSSHCKHSDPELYSSIAFVTTWHSREHVWLVQRKLRPHRRPHEYGRSWWHGNAWI